MQLKTFEKLSLDKQLKWIDQTTSKVLKRLPILKKRLKMYDDKSSELYNLEPSEVAFQAKVYRDIITESDTSSPRYKSLKNFIYNLDKYANTSLKSISKNLTSIRLQDFKDNILQVGGQKELDYIEKLLNSLTDAQRRGFTISKYFFDNGNLSSEDFVKFIDTYGISVGTAKLETYVQSLGYDTDEIYRGSRIKAGKRIYKPRSSIPKKRG